MSSKEVLGIVFNREKTQDLHLMVIAFKLLYVKSTESRPSYSESCVCFRPRDLLPAQL